MSLFLESEALKVPLYKGLLEGKSITCSGFEDNATTDKACMLGIQKRGNMFDSKIVE